MDYFFTKIRKKWGYKLPKAKISHIITDYFSNTYNVSTFTKGVPSRFKGFFLY